MTREQVYSGIAHSQRHKNLVEPLSDLDMAISREPPLGHADGDLHMTTGREPPLHHADGDFNIAKSRKPLVWQEYESISKVDTPYDPEGRQICVLLSYFTLYHMIYNDITLLYITLHCMLSHYVTICVISILYMLLPHKY